MTEIAKTLRNAKAKMRCVGTGSAISSQLIVEGILRNLLDITTAQQAQIEALSAELGEVKERVKAKGWLERAEKVLVDPEIEYKVAGGR